MSQTDRIEKKRIIKAPRSKVWRAISDSAQFGTWFKINFADPFRAGTHIIGRLTEPGYEGMPADFWIEQIEPEHTFSYRWNPYDPEPSTPPALQPKTLVTFTLADHPEGTALTIVESGFDAVPPGRREDVYRRNEGGWEEQIKRVDGYVTEAR